MPWLCSIIYLCLQKKLLSSILILLWTIVNIVFLQDRERRRWQQAARQQNSTYLRTASASVCTCPLLRCTYWCVYACSTLASTFVKHVLLFLRFPVISPCQSGKNLHAFKLHCDLFVQFLDLQNAISYEILKRKWSAWGQALLSGPWILFQFESLQDNNSRLFTLFSGSYLWEGKTISKSV